jgi:hypothetical protein
MTRNVTDRERTTSGLKKRDQILILQHKSTTFYGKGPHPSLRDVSRTALGKIRGIPTA